MMRQQFIVVLCINIFVIALAIITGLLSQQLPLIGIISAIFMIWLCNFWSKNMSLSEFRNIRKFNRECRKERN